MNMRLITTSKPRHSTRLAPGDRVRLNDRAKYREGRGREGIVAFAWRRWVIVDLLHSGEVTCRQREVDLVTRGA